MKQLINKYNVPGPRYTSYPTVPNWQTESFSKQEWEQTIVKSFEESNEEGISLYIHLPFCESLCTFCGCHKHITKQHSVETPYINALLKEWQLYLQLFSGKPKIKELHLGGGTPAFFSPENLEKLVVGILKQVDIHPEFEFGFEGHPNNTTSKHLEILYKLGFRRVSFGVQDYSPKVQKAIHRVQPFKNVKKVHQLARKMGYTSISHDLVYGLPHQTLADILYTIQQTAELKPDRISLYGYAHVPWIKGVGQRGFNENDLPKGAEKRALYEAAKEALTTNGYHEIGMDHFALKKDMLYQSWKNGSLHRNFMGYTTNTTQLMIGLGMSAISDSWYGFAQNMKSTKEYLGCIERGELPVFRGHTLSRQDITIRKHIFDLMCRFETEWCHAFTLQPFFQDILKRLKPLIEDGLIIIDRNKLIVTEPGKIFIRNICMCFDLYLPNVETKQKVFSTTI